MATREAYTERILTYATQQFIKHGCKRITMDDISNGMHISKRTLYEVFATKENLLAACLASISKQLSDQWRTQYADGTATIILMLTMFYKLANHSQNLSLLISDCKHYYPSIFNEIIKIQSKVTDENLRRLLNSAKDANLLRPMLDIDRSHRILSHYFSQIGSTRIENLKIISESGYTFMRGLLSIEAIKLIDQQEQNIRTLIE